MARDDGGRVTFVPRVVPGDRVRARVVETTKSFARAELASVIAPSPHRVAPPCPAFERGCGGCQWQHVARAEQLRAKQELVKNALRKLPELALHPIADPCPPLGWRRRARFHVERGVVGLYVRASHRVLQLAPQSIAPTGSSRGSSVGAGACCPQLEPALDAALDLVAGASPPDGELALLLAHDGRIVVGTERPWRGAQLVIGRAGIVGVDAGGTQIGETLVELEPGLASRAGDFAQASAAGNAALIAQVRAALGMPPGIDAAREATESAPGIDATRSTTSASGMLAGVAAKNATLVELYAGGGNFTRTFVEDGWNVIACDVVASRALDPRVRFEVGDASTTVARLAGPVHAVVLDPPRAGAAEALDGIVRLAPKVIVYVSCDPATLGRDAGRLAAAGYRATDAWPIDLMPQTSHVEVVLRLTSA